MNMHRTILAGLAMAAIALAAAGPASAQPTSPVQPAKKGCEIQLKGPGAGQSVVYQHGYKFSILAQDNKTHTYTCNDGAWEETVSLTAAPRSGIVVATSSGGVLQLG